MSKRIFLNIIKIVKYQTFSKLEVQHPPSFTCKPLRQQLQRFQRQNFSNIKDFSDGTWCNIHRHTPHDLAICYNTDKGAIVEEGFEIEFDQSEILPVGVKVGKEHYLWCLYIALVLSQRGCFWTR